MKGPACCTRHRLAPGKAKAAQGTGFLMGAILLVLTPKCPLCVAAYLATLTGISLSVTAATYLKDAVSLAGIALITLTVVARVMGNPRPPFTRSPAAVRDRTCPGPGGTPDPAAGPGTHRASSRMVR